MKMNIKLLITMQIFLIFICYKSLAHDWTGLVKPTILNNGTGYSTMDIAYSITIDASGNYYFTGFFDGKIGFGNDTLESAGSRDVFIVKMHSSGTYLWARRAGGLGSDLARDIAVDNSGNVYIIGYYYGTAKFGSTTLTANRNSDIFVAKLNNSGTFQWAKSAGGIGFDKGNAICVESNGTVYIAGSYENTSTFGTVSLNSSGSKDIFISKLSSAGNWIWSVKAGGSSSEEPNSIKYHSTSNKLIVGGFFASSCTFGATVLTSAGQRDGFLTKLDSNGTFNNSLKIGSTGFDEIKNLVVNSDGKVFVTGYFENQVSFGESTITSSGSRDLFVSGLNSDLNWEFAIGAGGTSEDEGTGIAIDNSSNIYITGNFYQTAYFGENSITSNGDKDAFIAKINTAKEFEWILQAKSSSSIDSYNIVSDNSGNTVIAGSFNNYLETTGDVLNSVGESDIFVAKANSNGEWQFAKSKGGVFGIINTKAITVDKQGNRYICGGFYGTILLGSDTLQSSGSEDVFVYKLSKNNQFLWARKAGGIDLDRAESIACDTNNNIFITGYFGNDATIGDSSFSSNGFDDIFIAKLDSNGNWMNANFGGSMLTDKGLSVAISSQGDIYISGIINNDVIFGDITISNCIEDDIFVAKLNSEFEWIWVINAGGSGWDAATAITVDTNENIFVTGYFEETATFGNNSISSLGYDDIFIAKLNSSGNWIWVNSTGSEYLGENGNSIISDNNNSVYFTGYYKNISAFGNTNLVSKGLSDAFIAKLNYDGNWIWAKNVGSTADDEGKSISFFNGNIYLSGNYSATFNVGDTTFTNQGGKDIFLIKYNPAGNLLWKETAGLTYDDDIAGHCIDNESNISLAGSFYHSTKFSNLQFTNFGAKNRNSFVSTLGLISPANSWTFKNNTGRSAEIKIPSNINPRFNHRNLQSGDGIGVFYTRNSNLYCAGWGLWNGLDLTVEVWGDDNITLVKDGMANNEPYIIKLWDAIRGIDTLISVRFVDNNKKYNDNNLSIVSRMPDFDDTLRIPLRAGWNMIASSIYPYREPSMVDVFKNIKNNIKIVKNIAGKVYIPENNINTIGNWNFKEGYTVYSTVADTLKIIGMAIDIDTVQINLTKGWNMLPSLLTEQMLMPTVVQSLVQSGNLKIVKNIFGKVYLPENGLNTIGNMLPKEAYQIYMNEAQVFSFP